MFVAAALGGEKFFHIYRVPLDGSPLRRLTDGPFHDIDPAELPDGRIVFTSTRQNTSRAILLDEGRPQYAAQTDNRQQPAFLLHVMNTDGSDIHQISYNTNHDFAPSVLNNGQIVFSRWERVNGSDRINLYRANPDGTGLELYYGQYSHATGTNNTLVQFVNARTRPDNKLTTLVRPFLGTQLGGDVSLIDAEQFVEISVERRSPAREHSPGGRPRRRSVGPHTSPTPRPSRSPGADYPVPIVWRRSPAPVVAAAAARC